MQFSNLQTGLTDDSRVALVTGASGLFGAEMSMALAKAGWKLGLLSRGGDDAVKPLLESMAETDGEAIAIQGDLLDAANQASHVVTELTERFGPPCLLVHAATAPVRKAEWFETPADLEEQTAVNAGAFIALAAAMLPAMLRAQSGTFVAILSQAMLASGVRGWHGYTVAKAALAQAVNELAVAYGEVGIRAISVLPTALTPSPDQGGAAPPDYLEELTQLGTPTLNPGTLAATILELIEDQTVKSGTAVSIDAHGRVVTGRCLAWMEDRAPAKAAAASPPAAAGDRGEATAKDDVRARLDAIMRSLFNLDDAVELDSAAIGTIPGWDSLGHIRLIMEIEAAFNVAFDSSEAVQLHRFDDLAAALKRHLAR